jgi:hypothetical protein
MGLKTVLFGRWYYKHVAPTELAAQLPAVTAALAPQSCDASSGQRQLFFTISDN